MGKKHKIIESSTSAYWIELNPVPANAYFSFYMPGQTYGTKNRFTHEDSYTVIFDGKICLQTLKVDLRTPITVHLRDVDGEYSAGGFLECRKGRKAELYFRLKKESFFTMCDYIKDGTVKYVRAFGEALYRGSAKIYSIDFSSHMDEE